MDAAIAIRPIIKVLVSDRVDGAPVMCHKIHRAVRTLWIWLWLCSSAPTRVLEVMVKHGIPVEGAATAVLAWAWRFCTIWSLHQQALSQNSCICIQPTSSSINRKVQQINDPPLPAWGEKMSAVHFNHRRRSSVKRLHVLKKCLVKMLNRFDCFYFSSPGGEAAGAAGLRRQLPMSTHDGGANVCNRILSPTEGVKNPC